MTAVVLSWDRQSVGRVEETNLVAGGLYQFQALGGAAGKTGGVRRSHSSDASLETAGSSFVCKTSGPHAIILPTTAGQLVRLS
jgi:hypothetical protein